MKRSRKTGKVENQKERSSFIFAAILVSISMSVGALSCVTSARRPSSDGNDPVECAANARGAIDTTACENARRAQDQDDKRFAPVQFRN